MEVFLIRHTAVKVQEGTCYGHYDVPLAPSFKEEMLRVRASLPSDLSQAKVFASPSLRCQLLAAELVGVQGYSPDERLRELNFGSWENRLWKEIDRSESDPWMEDFVNQRCPQGESFSDLAVRCEDFWKEVLPRPEDRILIITHGGWIRTLLCHLLGIPLRNAFSIGVDYGRLSLVKLSGQVVKVEYINR